jgi:hypothetical protein
LFIVISSAVRAHSIMDVARTSFVKV